MGSGAHRAIHQVDVLSGLRLIRLRMRLVSGGGAIIRRHQECPVAPEPASEFPFCTDHQVQLSIAHAWRIECVLRAVQMSKHTT